MRAIAIRDRDAGVGGFSLTDLPYPHAAENDVIVRVHAAGFTRGELDWPNQGAIMTRSHGHGHWDAPVFFGATGDLAYKQIFPAPVALVAGQRHRVARGRAA